MKQVFFTIAMGISLTCFGQSASYSFNNGNANDDIGSNDGTVNGATLTTDRFGNIDHAYLFDGIDDNINLGDHNAFQMGTGSFSISLWIKTDSIVAKGDILGKKSTVAGNNYNQYSISFNNSAGLIQGAIRGEASSFSSHSLGTNNIDTTGWNHIVMTYDTLCNCSELYVNNQLMDSDTLDLSPSTFNVATFPLVIGWREAQQDFPFKGKIDDLFIYKTKLSTQQVDSLYNAPNPSQTSIRRVNNNINLVVFPNPTTDILQIESDANYSRVHIVDLNGRLVMQSDTKKAIDLSELVQGMYLLKIFDEDKQLMITKKIIKE